MATADEAGQIGDEFAQHRDLLDAIAAVEGLYQHLLRYGHLVRCGWGALSNLEKKNVFVPIVDAVDDVRQNLKTAADWPRPRFEFALQETGASIARQIVAWIDEEFPNGEGLIGGPAIRMFCPQLWWYVKPLCEGLICLTGDRPEAYPESWFDGDGPGLKVIGEERHQQRLISKPIVPVVFEEPQFAENDSADPADTPYNIDRSRQTDNETVETEISTACDARNEWKRQRVLGEATVAQQMATLWDKDDRFADSTAKEVSLILDCSESAVKSRKNKTWRAMQEEKAKRQIEQQRRLRNR